MTFWHFAWSIDENIVFMLCLKIWHGLEISNLSSCPQVHYITFEGGRFEPWISNHLNVLYYKYNMVSPRELVCQTSNTEGSLYRLVTRNKPCCICFTSYLVQLFGAKENNDCEIKVNHEKFVHAMDVARAMFVRVSNSTTIVKRMTSRIAPGDDVAQWQCAWQVE